MKHTVSALSMLAQRNGYVQLNRTWAVDDSDLARVVRWAASKAEWRTDVDTPQGWFRTTCAAFGEAMGWGRTKAHLWMHDTVLFDVATDGRRGTLLRLRLDVTQPIPWSFMSHNPREQRSEQTQTPQVAEMARQFSFCPPVSEQKNEHQSIPPTPPNKEDKKKCKNGAIAPLSTRAIPDELGDAVGEEGRAPEHGEWSLNLRMPVAVAGGTLTISFSRAPAPETIAWLKANKARYDRTHRCWTGVLSPIATQTVEAACTLPAEHAQRGRFWLMGAFQAYGEGLWSVSAEVRPESRAWLHAQGATEVLPAAKKPWGEVLPAVWRLPAEVAEELAPAAVVAAVPPKRLATPAVEAGATVAEQKTALEADVLDADTANSVVHAAVASARREKLRNLWVLLVSRCRDAGICIPECEVPVFSTVAEVRMDALARAAGAAGAKVGMLGLLAFELKHESLFVLPAGYS